LLEGGGATEWLFSRKLLLRLSTRAGTNRPALSNTQSAPSLGKKD
jgi:hypothetical protein